MVVSDQVGEHLSLIFFLSFTEKNRHNKQEIISDIKMSVRPIDKLLLRKEVFIKREEAGKIVQILSQVVLVSDKLSKCLLEVC